MLDHSVDTCCWDVPTSGKEGLMTDRFVGFNIHFPWSLGLIYQSQFKSNSLIWKILFSATQWSPDCLSWTRKKKQVLVCRWVQWNWHHSVGVDLRWICMWDLPDLFFIRRHMQNIETWAQTFSGLHSIFIDMSWYVYDQYLNRYIYSSMLFCRYIPYMRIQKTYYTYRIHYVYKISLHSERFFSYVNTYVQSYCIYIRVE